MNILSIESSADETAVSVVEALGDFPHATYEILGNALHSQIEMHREYGGIYPTVAKREHAAVITPLTEAAFVEAHIEENNGHTLFPEQVEKMQEILYREPGLADQVVALCEKYKAPGISMIAVTSGPGLEPALWVGVNFAKALAYAWNIPVVPVNHMEGHVLASVFNGRELPDLAFPALALLISGGHTELDLMTDWATYEKIGQTRDDAVGEAFDKVARMMGLPYPGGPEISSLAQAAREAKLPSFVELPKPMLNSGDLDFSFSGLKTAVRYAIEGKELDGDHKKALARDFEDTVASVLLKKTTKAIEQTGAQSLVVGGGVSQNQYLKMQFEHFFGYHYPNLTLFFPDSGLSTDNSIMIALAGHAKTAKAVSPAAAEAIRADGNRSLSAE